MKRLSSELMSGISMIAEDGINALNAWLAKAGLRGEPEAALVNGFCERARRRRPADQPRDDAH